MRSAPLLSLVLALGLAARAFAQYTSDYTYNYDEFYDSYGYSDEYDEYLDEYGYYGDEDQTYYDYYGYYADDAWGYEDYYDEEYDFFEDCYFDENGKPILTNGTISCDIKIEGVDSHADKLPGGVDGVYKLSSCYNGKPLYKRVKSLDGEDRIFWYSSTFGDWDVSKGSQPDEAAIVLYGGEMEHATAPLFVSGWHLGGEYKSETDLDEDDFLPIPVKMSCADGSKIDPSQYKTNSDQRSIFLTPEEIEAKYKYMFDTADRPSPSPSMSFTFVILAVMIGLTIVLAIPYFLMNKKTGKGGKSTSFAQMLMQSKKKASGHVN